MVFKFLLLSDEVDDFAREISIDSSASFLDLQNAILDSVGYSKDEMTSFFICDDDWEKKTEITLVDMGGSFEEDNYVMEDTIIEDLLDEEKQKILFVFDTLTERAFFMELHEILPGKSLIEPLCSKRKGVAPVQHLSMDAYEKSTASVDLGENFYGDEEYDASELDIDGFDDLDMESDPDTSNFDE